ncbi:MAG: PKD domain-containing protein [bacterium]|nr:PKD domain-containing protein [bacterium]
MVSIIQKFNLAVLLVIIITGFTTFGCDDNGTPPVTPNNPQDPVAVAKADPNPQTINLPVSFSGSDSYDPDGGNILLFEWDWDNDGTFDETGENVDHTWSVSGVYFVQLRVTDDEGVTDILDEPLEIMISRPSDQNPVAVAIADPNPQTVNLPVSFSGSDSNDPDGGEIQLYEWDWDNDGIYDQTGENVDHTWSISGIYFVQLQVTDDEGVTDLLDDPLQVMISGASGQNPVAVASADPNPQLINLPVCFSGTGSYDPDGGEIQLFEWDWGNDATYDETGMNVNHTYSISGIYFVQLRVTDDETQVDILDEPLQIVISDSSNQNPVAIATAIPNPQTINLPVSFSGSGSYDPDGGEIQLFEWDWNNDGTFDETGENADHTWTEPGTFFVQLRVTDDEGQVDILDEPLQVVISDVGGQNPVAIANAVPNPQMANLPISFSGSGSYDPDGGDIQLFEWDWNNDGAYDETGENVNHTWTEPGTFFVQLRVTDDEGQVDILDDPLQIEISDGSGQNPVAIANAVPNPQMANLPISFSGSGSYDPDGGDIQLYEWDWNNDGIFDETGENVDHTWTKSGIFFVQLRVTDDESQFDMLDESLEIVVSGYYGSNLIWAKHAGGASSDEGYGITALSDNSTVVTGYFRGSATFGPGEPNQTILTSAGGNSDMFIARYNPDGTLAWVKSAVEASGAITSLGITTLLDNSTVMTGTFYGSVIFGPGELNQTNLGAAGNFDIFIARYNPDGTLAWVKRAGGPGDDAYSTDKGFGITTLSDNSTVVTGQFGYTATFGPGEPNETVLTSAGYDDTFIARYNPDGTLAWAKRAGGIPFDDIGFGITSLSDNSIVVTGRFYGSATFGPGEPNQAVLTSAGGYDIFIAHFAP